MGGIRVEKFRQLALNERHVNTVFNRVLAKEEERQNEELIYKIQPLVRVLSEKESDVLYFSMERVDANRQTIAFLLGQLKAVWDQRKVFAIQEVFMNYQGELWTQDWGVALRLISLAQAAWLLSPCFRMISQEKEFVVCYPSSYCVKAMDPRQEGYADWWAKAESTFEPLKEKTPGFLAALEEYTLKEGDDYWYKSSEVSFCLFELAAQQGIAAAIHNLGIFYSQGKGCQKDEQKAAKLFQKAAAMNYPAAAYVCGKIYRKGDGVIRDEEKARIYYRQSAELGYESGKVMCRIYELMERSEGNAEVMVQIAQLYEGKEVFDKEAAFSWYRKAADLGHMDSCLIMGFYDGGAVSYPKPAEILPEQSARYFQKAADRGDVLAKAIVTSLYSYGQVRNLTTVLLELADVKKFGRMDLSLQRRLNDMWMYLPSKVRTELMDGVLSEIEKNHQYTNDNSYCNTGNE